VDVLVNNAGCGLYGSFVDQSLPTVVDMLQLNMIAMTELTHIFAKNMVKRQAGHILLMASLLGYQATPGYAAYGRQQGLRAALWRSVACGTQALRHWGDGFVSRCNLNFVR